MPTSAATPGVSKDNFIKRGSDIYKEEEKKIAQFLLHGQVKVQVAVTFKGRHA